MTAWEGSLRGARGQGGRALVASFCDGIAESYEAIASAGLFAETVDPVISAGGSSFFDIVVERWADRLSTAAVRPRVVLRSGCYLTHDDGLYQNSSPFALRDGPRLRAAIHVWAQVVSRPERGLALLNAGRRDVPYDGALPIPQLIRGRDSASSSFALEGAEITQLNDQHAYLALSESSDLRLGEVIRCGISHPCTAFDKWTVIPVVDNASRTSRVSSGQSAPSSERLRIRHLGRLARTATHCGSTHFVRVQIDGAMVFAGDMHFAQGDDE